MPTTRSRRRAGFTLIEVLIAVTILSFVALALMSATGRMIRTVADDRTKTQAFAAAEARIAMIRAWPVYATLDSLARTEANTPATGWSRTTTVVRTGGPGQPNDYKRAIVTVTGPGLLTSVRRYITVAAP